MAYDARYIQAKAKEREGKQIEFREAEALEMIADELRGIHQELMAVTRFMSAQAQNGR